MHTEPFITDIEHCFTHIAQSDKVNHRVSGIIEDEWEQTCTGGSSFRSYLYLKLLYNEYSYNGITPDIFAKVELAPEPHPNKELLH